MKLSSTKETPTKTMITIYKEINIDGQHFLAKIFKDEDIDTSDRQIELYNYYRYYGVDSLFFPDHNIKQHVATLHKKVITYINKEYERNISNYKIIDKFMVMFNIKNTKYTINSTESEEQFNERLRSFIQVATSKLTPIVLAAKPLVAKPLAKPLTAKPLTAKPLAAKPLTAKPLTAKQPVSIPSSKKKKNPLLLFKPKK